MAEVLNLKNMIRLLNQTHELAEKIDGQHLNIEGSNNKELMRAKSEVSKQLLYAAHLADLARAEAMNQYHRFKGESPPTIT